MSIRDTQPYGGISRQDRATAAGGPWCDKAWHLDNGEQVKATAVLRCAECGLIYARCAQCNRGNSAVHVSMRAHFLARHAQNRALRRKVLPREE